MRNTRKLKVIRPGADFEALWRTLLGSPEERTVVRCDGRSWRVDELLVGLGPTPAELASDRFWLEGRRRAGATGVTSDSRLRITLDVPLAVGALIEQEVG